MTFELWVVLEAMAETPGMNREQRGHPRADHPRPSPVREGHLPRTEMRNQLYVDIPPEDFATTRQVLDLITQRARAIQAAP